MKNAPTIAYSGEAAPELVGPTILRECAACGEVKSLLEFVYNSKGRHNRLNTCKSCEAEKARRRRKDNTEPGRQYAREYRERNLEEVKARNVDWRQRNREHLREWAAGHRAENRDAIRAYHREWHARNPGKASEYYENSRRKLDAQRAEATRFDVPVPEDLRRARQKALRVSEWVAKNRDRINARARQKYRDNLDEERKAARAYSAMWRAKRYWRYREQVAGTRKRRNLRKAPWVNWIELFRLRQECRRISHETGVPHELDHIYPLMNDWVCGLDTPDNLRIIPRSVNRSKGNKVSSLCLHEFADVPAHQVFLEAE